MAQQIILRRGTSSEWTAAGTVVLAAAEVGVETDTGKFKIGNGVAAWNDLGYAVGEIPTSTSDLTNDSGFITSADLPNDENTTYSISATESDISDAANIGIVSSDGLEDNVLLAGSGTVSVSQTGTNSITITGTEFDTVDSIFSGTTTVNILDAVEVVTGKVVTGIVESSDSLILDLTGNLSVRAAGSTIFGSTDTGVDGPISQVINSSGKTAHTISMAHETVAAISHQLSRSRGTANAPLLVEPSDSLGSIQFSGYNGSNFNFAASITARVDASYPPNGLIPSNITFATNNGTTGGGIRAILSPTGVWKVNQLQALTTDGNLEILNNGTGIVQLPAGTTVGGVAIGTLTFAGSVADTTARNALTPTTGQVWIQIDNLRGYLWDGTTWVDLGVIQGPAGIQGIQGAQGLTGPTGPQGDQGQVGPTGPQGDQGQVGPTGPQGDQGNAATVDVGLVATALPGEAVTVTNSGTTSAAVFNFTIPAGFDGADGEDGADGVGIPVGGTTGQVLIKTSDTNYDTEWGTASTVAALDDLTDVVISGTPTTGQVLKYDGNNWINGTDNTATVFTRQTVSDSTSILANGATGPINITGFKSYTLLKVQTSAAAWVRIYVSEAARIADASRTEGEDPLPGAGIIAEVITTGAETVLITPGAIGFNDESPVTTDILCRVTNKSGDPASITVTLTAIQLEV